MTEWNRKRTHYIFDLGHLVKKGTNYDLFKKEKEKRKVITYNIHINLFL